MATQSNQRNRELEFNLGDIICFVENHSNGTRRKTYGLIIDEKMENKRGLIKIRWFDDWKDTWHLNPRNGPKYRIKNFFVVSKNKSQPQECPQEGD